MSIQQVLFSGTLITGGQQEYTSAGSFTWTAPAGVTSVCVVCVGAGGDGGSNKHGDGGGGLGWKNNCLLYTSPSPRDS